MNQATLNSPEIAQATLQGPQGAFQFHLFKTDASFQITNDILSGLTYPIVPFVSDVKTVVDIGANIGAASAYFAIAYPDARAYAFEPGSAPFSLLRQNAQHFPNVQVFPFGLHSSDQTMRLFHGKQDSMESSVCPTNRTSDENEQIRVKNAAQIFVENGIDRVDVLKIDTEGCEVPILQSLKNYLPEVKALYVEYHSERDRRMIDAILADTHVLWAGHVALAYRGEFCYLKRDLLPDESGTFACEILLGLE